MNGKHTHTILKTPQAGEYRCQGEYGGSTKEIATVDVPRCAGDAADLEVPREQGQEGGEWKGSLHRKRIVYARIDGIIKNNAFILMEVEAIEPQLWLEAKTGGVALEQLCRVFIPDRA